MARYADGGSGPELEAMRMVDRFGAQAVFGRMLYVREMRSMALADRIVSAHRARKQSGDWVEWAKNNPEDNDLLNRAIKAKAEHGS